MAGTPAGIIINSRFLSYGKEKRKPMRVWIHYPLWVCERNVAMKEKTPFHTWMKQCRKSGYKKMWLLYPGKCHDYGLFLIPIPSDRLPSG